jgi:hypothetical protein
MKKTSKRSAAVRVPPKIDGSAIERVVLRLRGQNVLLDADIAHLYDVEVKVLNQAVRRNRERFPGDFMFEVTQEEARRLRSQIVTLENGRGRYSKYLPKAFTEQGVAMLSSVLRSQRAIDVNIEIMRAFVRVRAVLASQAALARRLDELERACDSRFSIVFDAIRKLVAAPSPNIRRIGFRIEAPPALIDPESRAPSRRAARRRKKSPARRSTGRAV